ncbi:MAG: ATP-binding protein [Saprospiraceae bacterium]|nr:ATP-binding protein [Saprospiraceae bacterium]
MIRFEVTEKTNYSNQIGELVKKINRFIIPSLISNYNFPDGSINIVQVCFALLIDEKYTYFDYPYHTTVDRFNEELNTNQILKNKELKIHTAFAVKNDIRGNNTDLNNNYDSYLYYKYYYDESYKKYKVISTNNNVSLDEISCIEFLPIIDCAITTNETYNHSAEKVIDDDKRENEIKQILFLSKSYEFETIQYESKNLMASFEVDKGIDISRYNLQSLSKELYNEVFFFLKSHFESPILNKINREYRKSHILGYEHTINNYQLENDFNILNDNFKILERSLPGSIDTTLPECFETLEAIKWKIEQMNLFYSFIFGYEHYIAGYQKQDKILGNKLSELIELLKNTFPTKELVQFKNLSNSEYIFKDYLLMQDFTIIFWNLMSNSIKYNENNKDIDIIFDKISDEHIISIRNYSPTNSEMRAFIEGNTATHPYLKEGRPYRGWIIIKDILKYNKKLSLESIFEDESTTLKLKLK